MPGSDLEYEKRLFCRIGEGDEEAFKLIFREYTPKILHYVLGMVKSMVVAEELVQDCFLKIWVNRERLPGVSNPDHYLFIIARNRVMDHFRQVASNTRLQQEIWHSIEVAANPTEETVDANNSRRLIDQALNHLSDHKQRIFQLSRYEGLTHEEIAALLDISKNTVKNHLVETLRFLREYLARHTDPVIVLILFHFLRSRQ